MTSDSSTHDPSARGRAVAAIDIGTQSTNLLVLDAGGLEQRRIIRATRLGESLAASGQLSTTGIDRTVEAVRDYVEISTQLGVERIVVAGTAACRNASNTADLATALTNTCGATLQVISAEDEARLSFLGAVRDLTPADGPTLVLDIGGGSTELALGLDQAMQWVSFPFGAVVNTDSHLTSDPPRPEDLSNLIGAVSDELEELSRTHPMMTAPSRVVGIAGTIVTIAAVEIGLLGFGESDVDISPLHGFELTRDAAEDVFRTLATESLADRRLNPGLPASRADIIVAGCCILVAVMRRLSLDSIIVSTHSLLDGLAERERLSE